MEKIEKDLAELKRMSERTEAKLSSIPISKPPNRFLILVNEGNKLEKALGWLRSHDICVGSALVVQKFVDLTSTIVLKPSAEDIIIPPFLHPTITTLKSASIPTSTFYAIPSLELTTTAVSLLHNDIDLVLVVGCHCLSRREYEDVKEFNPVVEEIILKEAIQPVILFK